MRNGEPKQLNDPRTARDFRRLAMVFGVDEWRALPVPLRLFLSLVGVGLLGVLLVVVLALTVWYRVQHHDFEELAIEPAPGVEVVLNAFGHWVASSGVSIRTSPYVLDVRIRGPQANTAEIQGLTFMDLASCLKKDIAGLSDST